MKNNITTSWKTVQRQFRATLKSLLPTRYIGWTGWADGTVFNASYPNYIRVTLPNKEEVEAWNDGIPSVAGMQVDLYTDPDYPGLLRARQPTLSFAKDFPYVCINFHKDNHTWPGPDTVAVELRQFMPLHPSVNGFVLTVRAGWIETTSGLKFFASESVDLSSYKPSSGARYVLVSIGNDGLLTITSGTVKNLYSLVIGDIPERPLGHKRICAVRLHIGQAYIKDEKQNPDLLDLRFISSLDGDMFKATYDQNNDGIVDSAEKVDGIDAAGNNKYYGTDGSGIPGFHSLPAGDVEEAPLTGGPYGRQSEGWVELDGLGGDAAALDYSYLGETVPGTTDINCSSFREYIKKITITEKTVLTAIQAYIKGNGNNVATVSCLVYNDNEGIPSQIIASGTSGGYSPGGNPLNIYINTTYRWVSLPLGHVVLEPGDYWISFMCGQIVNNSIVIKASSGSDIIRDVANQWIADFVNGWYPSETSSYSFGIRALGINAVKADQASYPYIVLREEGSGWVDNIGMTSGDWRPRPINAKHVDTHNLCALLSNGQFSLKPGAYSYDIRSPAYFVGIHQARLYNVTDDVVVDVGSSEKADLYVSAASMTNSIIKGRLTIDSEKAFVVQHRCATSNNSNGMGIGVPWADTQVWATVEIWKEINPSAPVLEDWLSPSYQNGWTGIDHPDFEDARYRKNGVIVEIQGAVKNGTVDAVIFTLPEGYRPQKGLIFPATTVGGSFARVDVMANGDVFCRNGSNGYFSLSAIRFSVE